MRLRLCVGYVLRTKRREALLPHGEERRAEDAQTIICRNANTQQGIVTWRADLSLDEPAQLTSRSADCLWHHKQIYLHAVFVTVSSDCGWETLCLTATRIETGCVWTYCPKTQVLTQTSTRTQLKISRVPTVQSGFRSFILHQASKCTHCVIGVQDSVVGRVSRLRPGRSGARIPAGARHFLFSISCGLALGITQPSIQRVYSPYMPSWRVEGTPLPLLLRIVWALYCWDFALAMKIFALLYKLLSSKFTLF
jgi:hypothetical protein